MEKKRVLIVEDDTGVREVLAEFFSLLEFEVHQAGNSQEAVKLINNEEFSIYLLDIKLPQIDGLELARYIRKITDKPIIFLTGLINDHTKTLAEEFTNSYYLRKPVTFEMLKNILEELGVA
ncbi:response regulator [Thermodesulfatator autotrophicus]|uniref:Response regulatory domain-containing protein n=1 Tax=Thermodesulfatator autotrophicus TaxID=1795632 RepID=A0A177E803_9BACT|nr:response regulator [Thermodesulfatator autotrophicus]OAG28025.1 hypothetical protein TH606_04095 [Thermodesulfatator autotrophicus]